MVAGAVGLRAGRSFRITPESAGAPRGLVFLLAMMSAVGPLSIDMYLPSLPTIGADLHASAAGAQATVSVFFAGLALGQLFFGPASDRFGRRAPALTGLVLFVAASLVCAFTGSIHALLAARFAQALGGCASMVVARAVVRDHFDHQESARFFSLLSLVMGAAPILSPLAGSAILGVLGWRAIFALLVLIGLGVGLAVLFGLPESRSEATAVQARSEHPLRAYAALLKERRLLGYLLGGALNSACMFTYIASSPELLIGTYRVPAGAFGLVFGINAVGMIGASQLNRVLLRRFGADGVLGVSALISLSFAVAMAFVAVTGAGGLIGLLVPLFCTIASLSLITANAMAGALAVDPRRAGSTSALVGACSFAVGALASYVAGALSNGTARPMVAVIVVCLIGCAAALYGLALRRKDEPA